MIKAVGQCVGSAVNGFFYYQHLVGAGVLSSAQDVCVGFIFVYVLEVVCEHVHKGIEPLHCLHQRQQHYVP